MRYMLAMMILTVLVNCAGSYSKQLQSDCGFLIDTYDTTRMICGTIQVPENHARPNGRNITISYVIIKSEDSSSTEYPMIHFTGGPGGQALQNLDYVLSNPILKTRDIIRFDQRGIGKSSALPDLTSKLYDLFPQDLNIEQERRLIGSYISELRKECNAKGIEIEMYNTFQNARDVGMLMDHLGYEKYNLRGGSYGTRIARVVADYFPEKIHAAIYDSPAPHRSDYLITRLEDYSKSLRKVIDYCNEDLACNSQYPNLEVSYFEMLDQLALEPMKVEFNGEPYYINSQDAIFLLRYELYRNDSRERVPKFIYAFKTMDLQWINKVVDTRGMTNSNFAMFLACENYEEYDQEITADVVAKKYEELELLPTELPLFTSMYLTSSQFLKSYATEEMKEYKVSDIPSLIFINQYDPVTPPQNAAIFQSRMTNSHAFIIDSGGHGGGDMNCKRQIMDFFMTNPDKKLDADCLKLY
jgi:pimeloyl-ACP methyl ester carboxylesterase